MLGHRYWKHAPIDNVIETQLPVVACVDLLCHLFELGTRSFDIQWLALRFAKDFWEEVRNEAAEHQVGIRHSQRPAFTEICVRKKRVGSGKGCVPVTRRSWVSSSALWAS